LGFHFIFSQFGVEPAGTRPDDRVLVLEVRENERLEEGFNLWAYLLRMSDVVLKMAKNVVDCLLDPPVC